MKKGFLALVALFLIFPTPVHAATIVTLTAPPARHLDGTFIDDHLATDLTPTGKYGELVFNAPGFVNLWRIDPAFIEDVQAMTVSYKVSGGQDGAGKEVALAFLNRLKSITQGERVEALAYANPSEYWVGKFLPHDRGYILTVSEARLSSLLGEKTYAPTEYISRKYFSLTSPQIRLINIASARIQSSAAFLDSQTLENYKLSELKILSASLNPTQRQSFAYDLAAQVNTLRDSIHISNGKFTITSAEQKLPLTITNDFPKSVIANLSINSTNERIFVDDIKSITIPAKSKIQIMVPIKAYTSGDSGFTVTVTTRDGSVFGQTVTYPLTIAVISPVATWITAAAAIVLFGAAIFKSLRRFRKGKNRHEHR